MSYAKSAKVDRNCLFLYIYIIQNTWETRFQIELNERAETLTDEYENNLVICSKIVFKGSK